MKKTFVLKAMGALIVLFFSLGISGCGSNREQAPGTGQKTETKSSAEPAPAAAAKKEAYKFKMATFEPENSLNNQVAWLWWAKRVEELSGGKVKFELYPGESLVKGADNYEAVRDGIAEAGLYAIPYEANTIKLPTIKELPYSFSSYDNYYKMFEEWLSAGLQDYLHSLGIHGVFDTQMEPYPIWTTKKAGPVEKVEDLKGLKVRSPGGLLTGALIKMGAVPVAMPSPEAYTAMERGTLDAVSMVESSAVSYKLQETVKYVTRGSRDYPWGYAATGAIVAVNYKTWQSLPKDIQDIMEKAGDEAVQNFIKEQAKYQKEVIDPLLEKSGVEIHYYAPGEVEKLKELTKPMWDEWLAENGDSYNGLGHKLMDILKKYQ